MARLFRNLFFFCLGFSAIAVPMLAFAETISATGPATVPATAKYGFSEGQFQSGGTGYSTPADAASAWYAKFNNPNFTKVSGPYSYNCAGTAFTVGTNLSLYIKNTTTTICSSDGAIINVSYSCSSGTLSGSNCLQSYSCPAGGNWTLSGQTCTRPDCVAPETRQSDGTCKAACPSGQTLINSICYCSDGSFGQADGTCVNRCLSRKGTAEPMWTGYYYSGKGSLANAPSNICVNGCKLPLGGTGIGLGNSWSQEVGKYDGLPCLPADETAPNSDSTPAGDGDVNENGEKQNPDSDAAKCLKQGLGFGTVNEKVVCVDPEKVTQPDKNTTEKVTQPDGTETTKQTTRKTTCSGDTCTTVIQETTNGVTTTTTTTNPISEHCQQNPNDEVCKTAAAGGSGSDEGGSGEGASTSDLYQKKGVSAKDVFSDFMTKVKAAPAMVAAQNFFSVSIPSGSCSGLSASVDHGMGAAWSIDLTSYFCGDVALRVYEVLSIGLMIVATWLAFKVAFL